MTDIQFIPPDECKDCGWKPVKPNNANQVIATDNAWFITMIPGNVVAFFICPACLCIHANKNLLENVEKLREMKKKRIIGPPSQDMAKVLKGSN